MSRDNHRIDLLGRRFGALTVLRLAPRVKGVKSALWVCRCDCGAEVTVRSSMLRKREKKSCGKRACRPKAWVYIVARPEYLVWRGMRQRCYSKTPGQRYRKWGGRGVIICPQWKNDFQQFLADVGPRPSPQHSIDRYPNNAGNYEPGNCRWATRKEQQRNLRTTVFVEFEGKRVPLIELVEKAGIARHVVRRRLNSGWSLEDALLLTPEKGKPK